MKQLMNKRRNQSNKPTVNPAKQRKMRLRIQRGLSLAKLLLLLIIIATSAFLYSKLDHVSKSYYQLTANLGFTIKDITVEGQKYTSSDKITKALRIKPGMPIFAISLSNLKARLENLEWIKYAVVERHLPNIIHISIVERTPIALGQKDQKLYIIDDEGVIINEKEIATHLHLPIIIGDGSEMYASSLIKILKIDKELFKHVISIIRVSERRWNVRFDNDLEIKLPEENMEKAWHKVIKIYKKKELFMPDYASIDLRIANKIFVEKK